MKLFIKDHLSFLILFLGAFIALPILMEKLDGLEENYLYFIFLNIVLLIVFLCIRYARRKKMYHHLMKTSMDMDQLIHQPSASIEKAYSARLQWTRSYLLSKEEEYKNYSHEQQVMISHAVHQMKTPLSVIHLLIQSNPPKDPDLMVEWQKIASECGKLNFSLNQLLTYSRSERIGADLKIERISLKILVQEVVNELKDYFIEKEVYPKSEIDDHVWIYSDYKWLKVVVYQLLSNAVKYSHIHSSVRIHYDKGQLVIKNTGDTIPENEINRVFELFYTGSKGRIKSEATGIGLYLVGKILQTLNHPFRLESANKETLFFIDFQVK